MVQSSIIPCQRQIFAPAADGNDINKYVYIYIYINKRQKCNDLHFQNPTPQMLQKSDYSIYCHKSISWVLWILFIFDAKPIVGHTAIL